MIAINR